MGRNILHLGLGQVTTTILTILLSAALARALSPSDFGLMYLLTTTATFAYVVIDWGHGSIIIRETARNPDRAGDLMGSAVMVRTIAALLACPIAVMATWLLGYDTRTRVLTGVLILCWLPQYLGLSFGWVFRAHERMDRDALLNVVLKLATLIGSISCLALGGHLLGLILVWAVAGSLTFAIGLATWRKLQLPRLQATKSTAHRLMRDGAPLLAMSLAAAIEPFINTNILYKMSPPAVVGWLGAAWNVAGSLLAPASILGTAMFPRLSMAAGDPTEFKRTFDVSFRLLLLLAVLGAVGTYLFADVPVLLIFGIEKFGPTADNLRAFALVLLFMYMDMFLATAILASGRAGRLAGCKVASVVLTSGLAFLLIPYCQAHFANGGLGVMYAMVLGEMLMLFAAAFLLREVFNGNTLSDVCRCLVTGAVTVVLIRLLPAFTPFLAIPICIFTFAGLSLLFGAVKRSDLEMLRKSTQKPATA